MGRQDCVLSLSVSSLFPLVGGGALCLLHEVGEFRCRGVAGGKARRNSCGVSLGGKVGGAGCANLRGGPVGCGNLGFQRIVLEGPVCWCEM